MKKFILYLTAVLLIGCTAPSTSQEVPRADTINITLYNYSEFLVDYVGQSAIISDTIACGHEVILFTWRPDSVFLVSADTTRGYRLIDQVDRGVYLLTDGTDIPTVLHTYRSQGKLLIYFQRSNHIIRVAEDKNMDCGQL